ncbi:MAG: hypothetical protein JWO24_3971 [Rhodospirillales bacterium]|nr:hypothetical protein [Rhodospirillales bacterium]
MVSFLDLNPKRAPFTRWFGCFFHSMVGCASGTPEVQ